MKKNKVYFIDSNINNIIKQNRTPSGFNTSNNIQQWDKMMVVEKKKSRAEIEQEERERMEQEFYNEQLERANNPSMSEYLNSYFNRNSQPQQKIKIEPPVVGREVGMGVLQAQQTYENFVSPTNNTPVIIRKVNPNIQDIYQKEEQKEQVVNKLISKLHSNEEKVKEQNIQPQIKEDSNNPFNEFKNDIISNPFEEINKPTFVKGPIKSKHLNTSSVYLR